MSAPRFAITAMSATPHPSPSVALRAALDELARECLAIEVDTSLPAQRLVRMMEQLKTERGLPNQVRVDNGPELVSSTFADWSEEHGIEVVYIQKGKP